MSEEHGPTTPVLSFMCDVCGDDIDFPAFYGCDESECRDEACLVVTEGDVSTCSHCGAVGVIGIWGEDAVCSVADDDPARSHACETLEEEADRLTDCEP